MGRWRNDCMNNDPTPSARTSLTSEERLARLAERRSPSPRPSSRSAPQEKRTTRRRHPAKGSRIAALGLSIAATSAMGMVFAATDRVAAAPVGAVESAVTPTTIRSVSFAKAVVTPTSTTRVVTPATVASSSATFTGQVSTNKWGPVQVNITITNSKITNVVSLQTPDSHAKSVRINDQAVPVLKNEALSAQSAKINTVSGATYTSNSYAASLQSAIDTARAVGVSVA